MITANTTEYLIEGTHPNGKTFKYIKRFTTPEFAVLFYRDIMEVGKQQGTAYRVVKQTVTIVEQTEKIL